MWSNDHKRWWPQQTNATKVNSVSSTSTTAIAPMNASHLVDLPSKKWKRNIVEPETWKDDNPIQPGKPRIDMTVSCITGGFDICGTSISLAKRYCRSLKYSSIHLTSPEVMDFDSVKFSSEEASDLPHPHHETLVISILIIV